MDQTLKIKLKRAVQVVVQMGNRQGVILQQLVDKYPGETHLVVGIQGR